MFKRIALTAVLIATFALGASALGVAGNGNSSSKSSINLVMVSSSALSASATGGPHFGDTITFDVSTSAPEPTVGLSCSQNGVSVYRGSAGFYSGYPWPWLQNFTLSSQAWNGGAADCTATLYYFDGKRFRDLASTVFHVDA
jgi:hypothetical protein